MSSAAPSSSASVQSPKVSRAGLRRSASVLRVRSATVAPWRARNSSQNESKVISGDGAPRSSLGAMLSANQRRASVLVANPGAVEVVGEDLALEWLDHKRTALLVGQEPLGETAEAIEVGCRRARHRI